MDQFTLIALLVVLLVVGLIVLNGGVRSWLTRSVRFGSGGKLKYCAKVKTYLMHFTNAGVQHLIEPLHLNALRARLDTIADGDDGCSWIHESGAASHLTAPLRTEPHQNGISVISSP